jgi:PAS domain S-box-containing protein
VVWLTDSQSNPKEISSWSALTGQTKDKSQGMGWLDAVHPDDTEEIFRLRNLATETKKPFFTEHRVRVKDGTYRYFAVRLVPVLDNNGEIFEWVGTHTDITERILARQALTEANERLEIKVQERTQELQLLNTELQRSNQELEQFAYVASHDLQEPLRAIMGYTQILEQEYQNCFDQSGKEYMHYITDGAKRMQHLIRDLLAYSHIGIHGKAFITTDCNVVRNQALSNLQVAITESKAIITYDPLPRVIGDQTQLVQLFQNLIGNAIERGQIINQLRENEENTRTALLKEQELNQLKSEFVAMVSHEFRNPMTTIRTAVDLLQSYSEQITEERKTKYFQRMDNAINQMLQLLNEILFLTQNDADKVTFNPKSLDLKNLCCEIVDGMQFSIGNQNKINFAAFGESLQAQMDEELLNCILTNLLSNAIKYSPPNRDIGFNLNCQDDMAVFEIQDQGIGIPEKDQSHLFETFYRASNTNKIQGTGLGLVIVKRCVELHHGDIKVKSKLNVGTTVIITLPLRNT